MNKNLQRSDLAYRILESIEASDTDFRTLDSLSNEFSVDREMMRAELDSLTPHVRRAITFSEKFDGWYRLTSRGMTRQEKRNHVRALITFQSLRNSNF